ncbi:MAG TPA: CoA-transferase [Actinomycetota bacterium]|nr:CoA-transferase [Actinomycetota bacterium]
MITRDEHCVVACAEALRGSGEILVSPFGIIPPIAARLARLTFEPDIVLTDGEARALTTDGDVEAWFPFRYVFDLLSSGRRHVFMMPVQIDRFGNMNLSSIGDHAKPKVQVIGSRGAPGNTVNHATSYWVPKHSPRVFVDKVDFVSGVGTDRGGLPKFVITNLGVFDFETPNGSMRVRSLHPGVRIDEVRENTGFDLTGGDDMTRDPTEEELRLIREVLDPDDRRKAEL